MYETPAPASAAKLSMVCEIGYRFVNLDDTWISRAHRNYITSWSVYRNKLFKKKPMLECRVDLGILMLEEGCGVLKPHL